MESLILWLNLHEGEEISLNHLATQSGLAWATTSKYISLIERLQNLMPHCTKTDGGVRITEGAAGMLPILTDNTAAAALALMLQSRAGVKVDVDTMPPRIKDGLKDLEEMDCVTPGTWELTPPGWIIANDAYHEVLTSKERPRDKSAAHYVHVEGYQDPKTEWRSLTSMGKASDYKRIHRAMATIGH